MRIQGPLRVLVQQRGWSLLSSFKETINFLEILFDVKTYCLLPKIYAFMAVCDDISLIVNWSGCFIFIYQIHLYGTSLGGFLAQLFALHRPRRVRSLVLSNTFLETSSVSAAMPWAPLYVIHDTFDLMHTSFIWYKSLSS